MKISNISNQSFKAQFVMKIEPKTTSKPSSDTYEKTVDSSPRKANNVLKFIGFLQSKEGGEVLDKLPKDDVITMESAFFINEETGKTTIEPFLIYEPAHLTQKQQTELAFALPNFRAESTFLNPSRNMAPQFKKWVNDILLARKITLNDKQKGG